MYMSYRFYVVMLEMGVVCIYVIYIYIYIYVYMYIFTYLHILSIFVLFVYINLHMLAEAGAFKRKPASAHPLPMAERAPSLRACKTPASAHPLPMAEGKPASAHPLPMAARSMARGLFPPACEHVGQALRSQLARICEAGVRTMGVAVSRSEAMGNSAGD